jgi:large subunit ribosomal protein L13
MKTYTPRPRDIERRWYVIDASGAVLGRLASEVAAILRGKHKPIFAPHMDTGDHVIVVNASGVRLTGGKEQKKEAHRHSGYPGGLTSTTYARLMEKRPAFVVEKAVRGMLPKNSLGRVMASKLQVYAGAEHPHQAQKPEPLSLGKTPRWEGLPMPEPKGEVQEPAPRPVKGRGSSGRAEPAEAKRTSVKRRTAKSTAKATTAKPTTAGAMAKPTAKRTSRRTKREE